MPHLLEVFGFELRGVGRLAECALRRSRGHGGAESKALRAMGRGEVRAVCSKGEREARAGSVSVSGLELDGGWRRRASIDVYIGIYIYI